MTPSPLSDNCFGDVTRMRCTEVCSVCGRMRKLVGERKLEYPLGERDSIPGYWVYSPKVLSDCKTHIWRTLVTGQSSVKNNKEGKNTVQGDLE